MQVVEGEGEGHDMKQQDLSEHGVVMQAVMQVVMQAVMQAVMQVATIGREEQVVAAAAVEAALTVIDLRHQPRQHRGVPTWTVP